MCVCVCACVYVCVCVRACVRDGASKHTECTLMPSLWIPPPLNPPSPSLLQLQEQGAELSHLSSSHSKSESENASLNQQVEEMESKCHALERQQKELQQQLEEARAELETTSSVSGEGSLGCLNVGQKWADVCNELRCGVCCVHVCQCVCICGAYHNLCNS